MIVGNLIELLPDLYDSSDSNSPLSMSFLPTASSMDAESLKFLRENTKIEFKNNAVAFDLAFPMDLMIYTGGK